MTHAATSPDKVIRLQNRVEALERERKQLLALRHQGVRAAV
jgi:hypothetical protein